MTTAKGHIKHLLKKYGKTNNRYRIRIVDKIEEDFDMKVWILVKKDDNSNYAFGIGHTAAEAYRVCGELFGGTDHPYTTEQLKKEGYKAVKATIILEN